MNHEEYTGRRSIRLKGYDYASPGAYFITICAFNRENWFGVFKNNVIELNPAGKMLAEVWQQIPVHYPGIYIDAFIVMPNHIHGIVVIKNGGQSQGIAPTTIHVGTDPRVCPPKEMSIPLIVQRYKAMTTKLYADGVYQNGWRSFYGKLWQRNYYDHIIRKETELNSIRQYILSNPGYWSLDTENPDYRPVI